MITTKERSSLRATAHSLKPIMQLGKGGITETVLQQARDYLYNFELIKVKVLNNADFIARDVANDFAADLDAEIVSCIGNIITLYKLSDKENITHIVY